MDAGEFVFQRKEMIFFGIAEDVPTRVSLLAWRSVHIVCLVLLAGFELLAEEDLGCNSLWYYGILVF